MRQQAVARRKENKHAVALDCDQVNIDCCFLVCAELYCLCNGDDITISSLRFSNICCFRLQFKFETWSRLLMEFIKTCKAK